MYFDILAPNSNSFAHSRFVDKLTDFLRSFVGNHLRRFEGSAQFPVIEFLALVFKYTFLQVSAHWTLMVVKCTMAVLYKSISFPNTKVATNCIFI